jgi:succinoglycan biosynthesis protein ExoA
LSLSSARDFLIEDIQFNRPDGEKKGERFHLVAARQQRGAMDLTESLRPQSTISNSGPAVSVVVPCRNERDQIEDCLRSVLAQEPVPGGFELIIADGMSDDGTRSKLLKLAKENSRLRIVDNPGLIVSTGLNAAVREARGSVIVRMDAHTKYAPDYIRKCLEVLQTTGADNVGGPWVAEGTGIIGRAIAAAFQSPFSCGSARGHNPNYEGIVDSVYLGCWRRDVFERVGRFDEELVRNQDDEFNLRLTRAGGKIWQSPLIKSCYTPRSSLFALFKQYMQYGYWKVRVVQKHRLPASVRHLVAGGFVLSLIILLPAALRWPLAAQGLIGLVSAYSLCNVTASVLTAARHEWKLLPFLPAIFACYHFAYGYGFLRGVWSFIILRRGPRHSYTTLTRTSAHNS